MHQYINDNNDMSDGAADQSNNKIKYNKIQQIL